MTRRPSGAQWTLQRGGDELVVVEIGGGLRSWTRDGVPVLAGYAEDEMCLSGRGQLLIPWPNRIRDGRYQLDGTAYQLPLSEPKYHNASHGLARWAHWALADRTASALTVTHNLHPVPGWTWHLDLAVTYELVPEGLVVTSRVKNTGVGDAPFGYGAHPYVAVGSDDATGLTLDLPAAHYAEVDERMLPTQTREVSGTAYDFRDPHLLGQVVLDTCYTGLLRADDGRWRVTVSGMSALPAVTVWGDEAFGWAQVFTGKAAAEGEHGIAVEPMTCPADAYNSGTDLLRLAPGASWTGTWGISLA